MFHFLHSLPRNIELLGRCLLSLFHKLVKEYDAVVNYSAIKHTRNSLRGLDPKFEKPATQCSSMRHAQIWTVRLHPLRIPKKSSEESGWESEDLALEAWDRYAACRDKVSDLRAREAVAST